MVENGIINQDVVIFVVEDWNGDTPCTLSTNAPIISRGKHCAEARVAHGGNHLQANTIKIMKNGN
jgi:hypothetical protein